MSIKELAAGTAAKLRSAQVITDSVSVVKELVDNALDAKADTVVVMVSENVLDMIKVVDNGAGIAKQDRSGICKRSHTSKIRTLDDLVSIGGASLGFRGEALASIAELSGKGLVVTTRTKGDDTAMKLTINSKGMLQREERSKGGLGTIIDVQGFLQNVPVRRNLALQNAKRHHGSLKDLIRSYVLARPAVRFDLKVIGSKEKGAGLIYAPPRAGTVSIQAAALILFGKALTSACISVRWPDHASTDNVKHGFVVEALLLKPTVSPETSGNQPNHGQYVSIDSRPLSVKRGIGKDIVKLYKDELKSVRDGFIPSSTPFIALNILCPVHSYDVNVEPAKDDVAFTDAKKVRGLLSEMFGSVYAMAGAPDAIPGDPDTAFRQGLQRNSDACTSHALSPVEPDRGADQRNDVSSLIRAEVPPSGAWRASDAHASDKYSTEYPRTNPAANDDNDRPLVRQSFRDQNISVFEEDREEVPLPRPQQDLEHNERLSQAVTNPWTLARLGKPLASRLPQPESSDPIVPGTLENRQPQMPPTPLSQQKPHRSFCAEFEPLGLDLLSSPSPRKPLAHLFDVDGGQDVDELASPPTAKRPRQARSQPRQRQLNFHSAPIKSSQVEPDQDESLDRWLAPRQDHPMSSQPNTKPESSQGITLDDIPDARNRPRQKRQRGPVAPSRLVGPPTEEVSQVSTYDVQGGSRGPRYAPKKMCPPSTQPQVHPTAPSVSATASVDVPPSRLTFGSRQDVNASIRSTHCYDRDSDAISVDSPAARVPHTITETDNNQAASFESLEHKPESSCNQLVFTSTETIASIWAASARLEPLQTIEPRQISSSEPESVTFLECTEDDVYHWDAVVREVINSHARPQDDLSVIELNIEEALANYIESPGWMSLMSKTK